MLSRSSTLKIIRALNLLEGCPCWDWSEAQPCQRAKSLWWKCSGPFFSDMRCTRSRCSPPSPCGQEWAVNEGNCQRGLASYVLSRQGRTQNSRSGGNYVYYFELTSLYTAVRHAKIQELKDLVRSKYEDTELLISWNSRIHSVILCGRRMASSKEEKLPGNSSTKGRLVAHQLIKPKPCH